MARALVVRPDLLLADEPTAELDVATREAVLELLLAAAGRGAALVLATHDQNLANRCDRQVGCWPVACTGRPPMTATGAFDKLPLW